MSDQPERLCLGPASWAVYDRPDPKAGWEFITTIYADEPDSAARQGCVQKWATGSHLILVVTTVEVREYRITIETEAAA